MFLRIRGKGACPENSQATLMHLRGFKHANPRAFTGSITITDTTDTTGDSERLFSFAHFAIGVGALELVNAQRAALLRAAGKTAAADNTPAVADAAGLAQLELIAWKELWNVFDIVYDEISFFPKNIGPSLGGASAGESDVAIVERNLESLHASVLDREAPARSEVPAAFRLLTCPKRKNATNICVCTHYLEKNPIPHERWSQEFALIRSLAAKGEEGGGAAGGVLVSKESVVVLDVSGMATALADASEICEKIALYVAWSLAFPCCCNVASAISSNSSIQTVLSAGSVVVRLPFAHVPAYDALSRKVSAAEGAGGAATDADGWAQATLDMYQFLTQHILLTIEGLLLSLNSDATAASIASTPSAAAAGGATSLRTAFPVVHFVGSDEGDMEVLFKTIATTAAAAAAAAPVTALAVYQCDNLFPPAAGGDGAAALYDRLAATLSAGTAVSLVSVPVAVLLAGGDEPWDPYTLRERGRLNFCPCCGDCDHSKQPQEEMEGSDGHHHGHGHGHGHGHH